jgi:hypothetical protein
MGRVAPAFVCIMGFLFLLKYALTTATSPPKETRYTLIPKNRLTGLRNESEANQGYLLNGFSRQVVGGYTRTRVILNLRHISK